MGEYPQAKAIQLNATNATGQLVGGLRSFVFLSWLRVEVLWVQSYALLTMQKRLDGGAK